MALEFSNQRQAIADWWADLSHRYRKVAFFGSGQFCRSILDTLSDEQRGVILAIVDDDPRRHGTMRDIPVIPPEKLDPQTVDAIVLATDTYMTQMRARVKAIWGDQTPTIEQYYSAGSRAAAPWSDVHLSQQVLDVPTMLSPSERQYLSWLVTDRYQNVGRIVELGPFVGGSTVALAEGLRRSAHKDVKPVVSFDRFLWFGHHGMQIPDPPAEGADFRPLCWRYCEPFRPLIDLRVGSLSAEDDQAPQVVWPEAEPVEILFVDAAKTWAQTKQMFRVFGDFLVPGVSRIVFQDYQWFNCLHLAVVTELLSGVLELESLLDSPAYTATFKVNRPVSAEMVEALPVSAFDCGIDRAQQLLRDAAGRADSVTEAAAGSWRCKNALQQAWLRHVSGDHEGAFELARQVGEQSAFLSDREHIGFMMATFSERLRANGYNEAELPLRLYREAYRLLSSIPSAAKRFA